MSDDWAARVTEKLRNPKPIEVDGLDEYIHRVVAAAPPLVRAALTGTGDGK